MKKPSSRSHVKTFSDNIIERAMHDVIFVCWSKVLLIFLEDFVLNANFDNNNNTKEEENKKNTKGKMKTKKKKKNNFLNVPFEDQTPPSCLRCGFCSVQGN